MSLIRKGSASSYGVDKESFLADGDTVIGPSFRWRLEEV